MHPKILPSHLQRLAIVYLRQSTPQQVESNRESTERQYALAQRAQTLGWNTAAIQIFDGDLGKSGQSTTGRSDFHRLMASVGLGEVGAVFALEASRFSRSQADWHKLLDICALTDTLVIDHDGVYNPNDFNDRVILGFKGTWSHTELHGLRLRLQGAKLHKAEKGELRSAPPTGYVYDSTGQLVLDPDEGVVATLQLLFEQFRKLGTAFKVVGYFSKQNIPFPRRVWEPGNIGTLRWGSLNLSRVLAILHNPTYTGAYVYGRRRSLPLIEAGQITRMKTQQLPRDQWRVLIQDAHPAYLSWEEYLANEQQLQKNNVTLDAEGRQGSAREGAALLQGLVICGQCGRRMSPRYYGTNGKRVSYECSQRRKHDGMGGICWSVPGAALEVALADHVLSAVNSEQLQLSLAVLDELERTVQEQDRHWQLRLERVRYEAERAERQYNAVEPENRLVARTLEKRWNEKLEELAALEQEQLQARKVQQIDLSEKQRLQILQLAQNLPIIWQASTTTVQERKEMLGLLVKQISLTPIEAPERQTQIRVLWHTGAVTELMVERPTTQQRLATPEIVVQAVRDLAFGRTDTEIAQQLNEKGFLTGRKRAFTADSVAWIRWKFNITKPESDPRVAHDFGVREDGYYSTSALAEKIGVSIYTIHYWREKGVLTAIRETPHGPWWYPVTPEVLKTLQTKIRRVPVNIRQHV